MVARRQDVMFDSERFIQDVHDYAARRRWSHTDVLAQLDLCRDHHSLKVIRGTKPPSLLWVCRLAWLCDLDINKYVKDPT
jgi:hypothetical protein